MANQPDTLQKIFKKIWQLVNVDHPIDTHTD